MDSTPKQLKSLSKFMSLILRHKPEDFGVVLDPEGWTGIDELLEAMNRERPVTRAQLEDVVQQVEPDKQRFSIEGEESLKLLKETLPPRRKRGGKKKD